MNSLVNYPECFREALENCGYRYRPLHSKFVTYMVRIPSTHKLISVWGIKSHGDVGVTCILEGVSEEWKQPLVMKLINELNAIHRFAKITFDRNLILFSYDFLLCGSAETAISTAEAYITLILETIIPSILTSMTFKTEPNEPEVITK